MNQNIAFSVDTVRKTRTRPYSEMTKDKETEMGAWKPHFQPGEGAEEDHFSEANLLCVQKRTGALNRGLEYIASEVAAENHTANRLRDRQQHRGRAARGDKEARDIRNGSRCLEEARRAEPFRKDVPEQERWRNDATGNATSSFRTQTQDLQRQKIKVRKWPWGAGRTSVPTLVLRVDSRETLCPGQGSKVQLSEKGTATQHAPRELEGKSKIEGRLFFHP